MPPDASADRTPSSESTPSSKWTPSSEWTPLIGRTPPTEPAFPAGRFHLDLQRARGAIVEAELTHRPAERYLAGHLAALRVAAIVLALRTHPAVAGLRSRPRNAWPLVAEVAPEFGEWAAFFAATEAKRDAVRAGATSIVSAREADDLVRDTQTFLTLVERAVREQVPTRRTRLTES